MGYRNVCVCVCVCVCVIDTERGRERDGGVCVWYLKVREDSHQQQAGTQGTRGTLEVGQRSDPWGSLLVCVFVWGIETCNKKGRKGGKV